MKCYGKAETLDAIRNKKTRMFNLLKNKQNTAEYEQWFLKYDPSKKKGLKRVIKTRRVSKTKYTSTSPEPEKTTILNDESNESESDSDSSVDSESVVKKPAKKPKTKSNAVRLIDFFLQR